jgi:hypothetical protein
VNGRRGVKEAFADDSGDNRKNKRKNNQVSQPDSHETPLQTANRCEAGIAILAPD